ncbi:hypothetical protein B0H21DRAFT_766356 [Amylocystis lapponica]|nr:hypothetical protein B0H21DRAFT_766356 [Amylocystis lapponica]
MPMLGEYRWLRPRLGAIHRQEGRGASRGQLADTASPRGRGARLPQKWSILFTTMQCVCSSDLHYHSWSDGRHALATSRVTSLRLVSRMLPWLTAMRCRSARPSRPSPSRTRLSLSPTRSRRQMKISSTQLGWWKPWYVFSSFCHLCTCLTQILQLNSVHKMLGEAPRV